MSERRYPRRPGRPAGPAEDRGQRPYDPRRWTARRQEIISAIHRNREALERGHLMLCELAVMLGTSPSYLSIVKNSPWGQRRLRALAAAERHEGNHSLKDKGCCGVADERAE